jgi:nicotinate-nucleotide adenylyltransferase
MKIGLFFGSFNPIHLGHLAIANYMVEYTDNKEIWFVISPHNPFKKKKNLLDDYDRLELVHKAINDDPRFRASDIEFRMPKPSYTIDTLTYLNEKFPQHEYSLIMGSDGLPTFHKWKNANEIIRHYHRFVYPRPDQLPPYPNFENATRVKAPLMEISASFIRKAIKEGKNIRHFLPYHCYDYIDKMNFYK